MKQKELNNRITLHANGVTSYCFYDINPVLFLLDRVSCIIAAQKWTPQGLIISNPKQKLSDSFITKPSEREQRVPTTLPRLAQSYMDSWNTDQAE